MEGKNQSCVDRSGNIGLLECLGHKSGRGGTLAVRLPYVAQIKGILKGTSCKT